MVQRSSGEGAIHEGWLQKMGPAYALALRLLSGEDDWQGSFHSRADILAETDADVKTAEQGHRAGGQGIGPVSPSQCGR
jgi:hypothetical protein